MPARRTRIGYLLAGVFVLSILDYTDTALARPAHQVSREGKSQSQRVSGPAGFHRRPLAEPSVRLSPHSAPIRQTCRSYRAANVRKDLHFPGQAFRESDPRGSCELQSA